MLLERIAAALIGTLIVLGSLFLWIGCPLLGMWLAGQLTTTSQGFLFATLGGIPLAMVAIGFLLYRLNRVYEDVRHSEPTGGATRSSWLTSQSDERSTMRRARASRSLIDVAMTASAVIALVVMVIWFFFLANMHLAPMQ